MNKLALSVVVLMVAGAGAASAVGCSSSSGVGTTGDDSGADVTTTEGGGDDSGMTGDTGTPTGDSGTPQGDSSTPVDSGTPMCTTDGGGIPIQGADGGENTACETCLGDNANGCGQQQCFCTTDTNLVPYNDAGAMAPGCEVFAACVYGAFTEAQATMPDAGAAANLTAAEMYCKMNTAANMASQDLGAKLISCVASTCVSQCVQ